MRGSKVAADVLERAAEIYGRTGNLTETARQVGVPESTLRGALQARQLAKGRVAHARACEAGLRKGRKALTEVITLAHRVLVTEDNAGVGLEPKYLASLINAISRANDALVNVSDREDRRRGQRLARMKTRAELAALANGAPVRVEITDVDALRRRLLAAVADDGCADGPVTPQ